MSTSEKTHGKGKKTTLGQLSDETGIDEATLGAVVGGTVHSVKTHTAISHEIQGGSGKNDGGDLIGKVALDAALQQSYHPIPTEGAGATTHVDATHASASAGAGVTHTHDFGHGVNLVSTAGAQATAEAHVGPLGVAGNIVVGAQAKETINLTEHADITLQAQGNATGSIKAGVTGVGGSGYADASIDASINQHEKGALGGGVDGMQQTTVGVGVDAHAGATLGIGQHGAKGAYDAFAGAYAKAEETAGISGHGVSASTTVGVYSPGTVGAHQSGTVDLHDGKLNVGFSVGGAFLIGGGQIGGNISIDTKPIQDGAVIAGHAIAGVAAPVVAHAATEAAHTVVHGATDAAHTVAQGTTAAASTVAHGVTDTAHTVAAGATHAAHTAVHHVSEAAREAASVAHDVAKLGISMDTYKSLVSHIESKLSFIGRDFTNEADHLATAIFKQAGGDLNKAFNAADGVLLDTGKVALDQIDHVLLNGATTVTQSFDTAVHAGEAAAKAAQDAANAVLHGLEDAGRAIEHAFSSW